MRRITISLPDDLTDALEREAYAEVDALLPDLLAKAGVSRPAAEAADAITNICDVLSFEFCFEEPSERGVRGHRIALDGFGRVEVGPWPFVTPRLLGLVTAFAADGYPAHLVPVVVPYEVVPA